MMVSVFILQAIVNELLLYDYCLVSCNGITLIWSDLFKQNGKRLKWEMMVFLFPFGKKQQN